MKEHLSELLGAALLAVFLGGGAWLYQQAEKWNDKTRDDLRQLEERVRVLEQARVSSDEKATPANTANSQQLTSNADVRAPTTKSDSFCHKEKRACFATHTRCVDPETMAQEAPMSFGIEDVYNNRRRWEEQYREDCKKNFDNCVAAVRATCVH